MAQHVNNPPDIFDINRIVLNEENISSKETSNNNSNGSDSKTHNSSPSSVWIGLESGEEENYYLKIETKELIKTIILPLMRLFLA